ncbi:MAG: DUF4148 domain-containing protein [Pseudomonadota bacterium]
MMSRKSMFAVALVGAVAFPAFASSPSHPVAGERGFEFHDMPSTKTRADVAKELADSRKNPFTADGGKLVAGGLLYSFPQHSLEFRDGKAVHTDKLSHEVSAKPDLTMTADEKRAQYRQNAF